jgi:imidazolonepropionase
MLSMGLPVALGTDFSPSNWTLSMLKVAAIAARRLSMQVEDIVRGITINAARALGLQDQVGSLETGKMADIVVLNASSHKMIGYSQGDGLIDKVLIAGKLVLDTSRNGT